MPRLRNTLLAICAPAAVLVSAPGAAQDDRHDWTVRLEMGSSAASTADASWLAGGMGKLRYDERSDGAGLRRAFVEYAGRLTPMLSAHVVADYVDDGDGGVDVTEAYLRLSPTPRSANRHRVRIGAFYAPFSLENVAPGWSSPFTISPSAINTWIGEELRTLGAEWSLERRIGRPGSPHSLGLHAAAFAGNDPAGTLMAWKGWGLHDRQTRLGDVLPLPPVPQIQPGMMFDKQAPRAEPFVETDDRVGYYAGGQWRYGRRVLLTAARYDNRADPETLREGQYGWTTRFDHAGVQLELPGGLGLIGQWLDGTTQMGPVVGAAHVADAAFRSYFVLLTKALGRHRFSARYDDFEVVDRDGVPLDDNGEDGRGLTLAYGYSHSERWSLAFEWLAVESERPARAYLGVAPHVDERTAQLRLGIGLGR